MFSALLTFHKFLWEVVAAQFVLDLRGRPHEGLPEGGLEVED